MRGTLFFYIVALLIFFVIIISCFRIILIFFINYFIIFLFFLNFFFSATSKGSTLWTFCQWRLYWVRELCLLRDIKLLGFLRLGGRCSYLWWSSGNGGLWFENWDCLDKPTIENNIVEYFHAILRDTIYWWWYFQISGSTIYASILGRGWQFLLGSSSFYQQPLVIEVNNWRFETIDSCHLFIREFDLLFLWLNFLIGPSLFFLSPSRISLIYVFLFIKNFVDFLDFQSWRWKVYKRQIKFCWEWANDGMCSINIV